MSMDARDILNGAEGECWIDGEKLAECKKLNAKCEISKEEVKIPGTNRTGHKQTGWSGKGSMTLHHISSRLLKKCAQALKNGEDVVMVIYSKIKSKNGTERVILKFVTFDDLTLIDWETGSLSERECPFTFEDFDVPDYITKSLGLNVNVNGVNASISG